MGSETKSGGSSFLGTSSEDTKANNVVPYVTQLVTAFRKLFSPTRVNLVIENNEVLSSNLNPIQYVYEDPHAKIEEFLDCTSDFQDSEEFSSGIYKRNSPRRFLEVDPRICSVYQENKSSTDSEGNAASIAHASKDEIQSNIIQHDDDTDDIKTKTSEVNKDMRGLSVGSIHLDSRALDSSNHTHGDGKTIEKRDVSVLMETREKYVHEDFTKDNRYKYNTFSEEGKTPRFIPMKSKFSSVDWESLRNAKNLQDLDIYNENSMSNNENSVNESTENGSTVFEFVSEVITNIKEKIVAAKSDTNQDELFSTDEKEFKSNLADLGDKFSAHDKGQENILDSNITEEDTSKHLLIPRFQEVGTKIPAIEPEEENSRCIENGKILEDTDQEDNKEITSTINTKRNDVFSFLFSKSAEEKLNCTTEDLIVENNEIGNNTLREKEESRDNRADFNAGKNETVDDTINTSKYKDLDNCNRFRNGKLKSSMDEKLKETYENLITESEPSDAISSPLKSEPFSCNEDYSSKGPKTNFDISKNDDTEIHVSKTFTSYPELLKCEVDPVDKLLARDETFLPITENQPTSPRLENTFANSKNEDKGQADDFKTNPDILSADPDILSADPDILSADNLQQQITTDSNDSMKAPTTEDVNKTIFNRDDKKGLSRIPILHKIAPLKSHIGNIYRASNCGKSSENTLVGNVRKRLANHLHSEFVSLRLRTSETNESSGEIVNQDEISEDKDIATQDSERPTSQENQMREREYENGNTHKFSKSGHSQRTIQTYSNIADPSRDNSENIVIHKFSKMRKEPGKRKSRSKLPKRTEVGKDQIKVQIFDPNEEFNPRNFKMSPVKTY